MAASLAEQLETIRRQRFVGRQAERDLFRVALAAESPPYYVLYIHGPGGVGKTTLTREFMLMAEKRGSRTIYLDGRNVEPTPETFQIALKFAAGVNPDVSLADWLRQQPGRVVIVVDTYELLAPIDGWLRDQFLPRLSANVLVVLAGRNPPSYAWRTDPGWRTFMRILPLRNLDPDESQAYMEKHRIPAGQRRAVLDFTHGHPLALSLVADQFAQRPDTDFQPEEAPDMINLLLQQFVEHVPSPKHRAALEAYALVRITTESLLQALLEVSDAHPLFEWLRGLSITDAGREGLFPHDLAREALLTDLRWRSPGRYAVLHERARTFYTTRINEESRRREQRRILFDYIYLHRDNPAVRPYFEWQESGLVYTDRAGENDPALLLEMVRQHEGADAAQLAEFWLKHRPDGVVVFRNAARELQGFLLTVDLETTSEQERRTDPAMAAAWDFLKVKAPLRPGERATYFRFWMDRNYYQGVSAVQGRVSINVAQHNLTTEGLAYTFIPCLDPDFWAPVFTYFDLHRLPEADFTVGNNRFGVFGHDWRVTPPFSWLALMAEREIATANAAANAAATTPPRQPEQLIVLSESAFKDAVRDALRQYHHPDELARNPLVRSRLVIEAGPSSGVPAGIDPGERGATLQKLVREAAGPLRTIPRERKFYDALHYTYLEPQGTQEQVAEYLDVPFSTYRRHLRSGIDYVVQQLWQREIGTFLNIAT